MPKIVGAETLAPDINKIVVEAPQIASKASAGQFVVLRVDEQGERIPLTIFDWDSGEGTIDLVFLKVGTSTQKLGRLKAGDTLADILGPLGKPFPVKKYGKIACVGGGLGIPAIHPIARAMRQAGNEVVSVVGARTRQLMILSDEMSCASDSLLMCSDDGSCGVKGFVTNVLTDVLDDLDLVVAVGPVKMMEAVAELTRNKADTIVSLNPVMVDGTGMCGACRVKVGGQVKFACVDGPDFNAHQVDFKELWNKNNQYVESERHSMKCWGRGND
ncbi:MAG: sulfide/dihydroorotate dehydrogenase-like FAD/NAD-binding protein [Candidatus Altiarchaeales archaeon]|nr:sulfide/dihydroorotate dehydrogenase-like FAD/NAD-binding protein [Candidatus Altiarchaeales archaeon]